MSTKNLLYQKLGRLQGEDKVYADKIDNIFDILNVMPEDVDFENFSSVNYFLKCDFTSRLDELGQHIDNMLGELREWVSKNTVKSEGYVMNALNRRTRIILFSFLAVIIVLALAAIACTIAHAILGDAFSEGDTIAEIIGTSDFVIGVIGFVVERFDDLGKREVRAEAEKVKAGESPDEFIKKCNEHRVINVNIGIGNKISSDTYNYYTGK